MFSIEEHAKRPSWKNGRDCLNSRFERVISSPLEDMQRAAISATGLFCGGKCQQQAQNLEQTVSELLSHANEDVVTSRYVKRSTFTHIVHLLQKCRIQYQSLCLRQPPKEHVVQRQIPGASTYTSGYIPGCILLVFRAGVECQEFTQA